MRDTPFQVSSRAVAALLLSFVAGLLPHASFGMPQPLAFDSQGQSYDTIRHEIERAGRQGNLKSLNRLISEIDRNIARVTPIEETACWQLLKATALVEIGRTNDATAIFGMLADTCPIWEAFNNVAVLEAANGEFRRAREHLRQSVDKAKATDPEEAALPAGNLRKLEAEEDVLSLTLVGSAKECSPVPRAQCFPSPLK